jgi:hypothetical protein
MKLTPSEKKFLKEEGFTLHGGGSPRFPETTRLTAAIRVGKSKRGGHEGIMFARPGPAYAHMWEEVFHEGGLGAPVAYKVAE